MFVKQQEQLKSMQRTLEDEENYETTSIDADPNPVDAAENLSKARDGETAHQSNSKAKTRSGPFHDHSVVRVESSSDEASVTEKHDCIAKSQDNGQDTQDIEITSTERNDAQGAFGSDINGIDTAPLDAVETENIPDIEGVNTPQMSPGGAIETEHVMETESQTGRNFDLNKCSTVNADRMQVDDKTNAPEVPNHAERVPPDQSHRSQSQDPMEDTEGGGTIKTTDLLASEAVGSWACSTAPSVHGENDSPGSNAALLVHDSSSLVAETESQNIQSTKAEATARRNQERRALSEMIGIVAPDLKEQFSRAVESDDQVGSERRVAFNSDTEESSDDDDQNNDAAREASDAETVGSDRAGSDVEMDVNDDTQEDSVG